MFGIKSKAEKEKELTEKIERKLNIHKSKEEAEKKLGGCEKKFKAGATFKYLGLPAMLRNLYVAGGWGGVYFVAVDAVYVSNGEVLPLDIDVELLETLIKL
jgi:hypothetical protein